MKSISPRERLNRLVELAAETSAAARRELTNEVAGLLLDWPSTYPEAMREPFEALLEKSLADIEPEGRALLAERFAKKPGIPLPILNALIFDASPEVRAEILARNGAAFHGGATEDVCGESALLAGLRVADIDDIAPVLSAHLHVPQPTAARIVADSSATTLAVLCRGAGLSRPTFSALAVLSSPSADVDEHYRRLAAYDDVPDNAAISLLSHWRRQVEPPSQAAEAA
jgi:hypothetical protein